VAESVFASGDIKVIEVDEVFSQLSKDITVFEARLYLNGQTDSDMVGEPSQIIFDFCPPTHGVPGLQTVRRCSRDILLIGHAAYLY
jgi:hypothetical protein